MVAAERRDAPAGASRAAERRRAPAGAPDRPLELGLVGAFPFPAPRGSQRFLLEQARALVAAGARVRVLCYGRGDGRALPDLPRCGAPRALSPREGSSALAPGKLVADAALAAAIARAHRARPFDALLAHNAEAALAALLARAAARVPLVYVAHTLWREEAASYLPARARPALSAAAARLGGAVDALCARRADGVLALARAAAQGLAPHARGPLEVVPPGLLPAPPPAPAEVDAARARHGLAGRPYAVYAGNLDAYQDLGLLDGAAARVPTLSCVAVTHDAAVPRLRALRVARVATPDEARALVFGARVAVLPRRAAGGFPIKLLGYLEAGLPVVAFRALADTLEHGVSGWLLAPDAGPEALAAAVGALAGDAALRARLSAGARAALAARHAWPALAARTLALVEAAGRGSKRPRTRDAWVT